MREKLIDLIIEAKKADPEDVPFTEFLADFLLANGVTVQEWISIKDRLPGEKEGEPGYGADFFLLNRRADTLTRK